MPTNYQSVMDFSRGILPKDVRMLRVAYTRLPIIGTLEAMFLGVQAAVLAVILRAFHRIGQHILLDRWLWLAATVAAVASYFGVSFWIVLPAAGAAYALVKTGRYALAAIVLLFAGAGAAWTIISVSPTGAGAVAQATTPTVAALFWAGLKGGLLTFGGAYTAIPFVRDDTVGRGWMTDAQFLDGLALSGILPAPLVIFSTFVGWVSGGPAGALAITAGMFLPAFAFSLIFYEHLEEIAERKRLQLFLGGVAAGVVGVIVITMLGLMTTTFGQTPSLALSLVIFALSIAIMYQWKSKLATPVVLASGAIIGAMVLK